MLLWVGPLSLTFFRKLFDESLRSRLLQSLFLSFFHGTLDICLCFLTKLYISPAQIPVLSTTMHLKMNGVFQPNSIQQWFSKGNSKYHVCKYQHLGKISLKMRNAVSWMKSILLRLTRLKTWYVAPDWTYRFSSHVEKAPFDWLSGSY